MAVMKKKKKVNPTPRAYSGVISYLNLENAKAALTFYKKAFGAKLRGQAMQMGKKIGHAELEIGNGLIMLADTFPQYAPEPRVGQLLFYVSDVDKAYLKAIKAGAKSLEEPTDKFYGDRMCRLLDPFGVTWMMATHVEDVSPAEMNKRMKAMK